MGGRGGEDDGVSSGGVSSGRGGTVDGYVDMWMWPLRWFVYELNSPTFPTTVPDEKRIVQGRGMSQKGQGRYYNCLVKGGH